jgi:amino acid transporter
MLFLGYKFIKRTRIVRIEDMDLLSGKEEADELESMWEEPKPRNFLGKFTLRVLCD